MISLNKWFGGIKHKCDNADLEIRPECFSFSQSHLFHLLDHAKEENTNPKYINELYGYLGEYMDYVGIEKEVSEENKF